VPITKRRRFNELSNSEAVWFLPIQRPTGQRFRDIPDNERSTLLFSSEGTQTRIFALSSKINPEQIGRIAGITINAGPFFQRSCVVHVSPTDVNLLDSGTCFTVITKGVLLMTIDGKLIQSISSNEGRPAIVSASIQNPYITIKRADGSCSFFVGDPVSRTITESGIPGLVSHASGDLADVRRNPQSRLSKSLQMTLAYIGLLKHRLRQTPMSTAPRLAPPLKDKDKPPKFNLPRIRSCDCKLRSRQFRRKSLVYRTP
jgi:hypothetical protein